MRFAGMRIVALFCFFVVSSQARAANKDGLTVAVDPRVELMSIIFRLAGNPEYNQGRLERYIKDLDEHFGAHREHAVIKTAQRLRRTRGVSFDAVMSMAVHVSDAFELQERIPFDSPDVRLDRRWRVAEAREFLEQARDFVQISDFRGFIESHRSLYETADERMKAMLAQHAHLEWFEQFFGARPTAKFIVIPGPLNGGQAYGPSVRLASGDEELFAIIGIWKTDEDGQPLIDAGNLPTVIHEFAHSFVNHLVEKHESELQSAGEKMYPLVAAAMKRQAYGDWPVMFKESVVRASVIRYLLAHDREAAAKQLAHEKERSFHWMPELVALIDEYENNRADMPTFDLFMPRIVAFFNELAPNLADNLKKTEAELEARRPKVVSISPADGAEDVDPATGYIVITFDRPMSTGGYSVMLGPGGRAAFPKVIHSAFDEEGRVFTMKVELEPNRRYEFTLNGESGGSFKALDGTPLQMTPVRFATGAARADK